MRHLPCVGVGLLTVDADFAQVSLVALYKLGALHKHAAASAARVGRERPLLELPDGLFLPDGIPLRCHRL